ncbi:hypothetical protein ACFLW0_01475 [Chloroflexota bacterium]
MDVSPGGTIKIEQTTSPSYPYTLDFDADSEIIVEAIPAFGYVFDSWSGDYTGTDNPATLTLDCSKSITANFSRNWILIGETGGCLLLAAIIAGILIIRLRSH